MYIQTYVLQPFCTQIYVLQPIHCTSRYLCCSIHCTSRYICCSPYTVHLDICAVAILYICAGAYTLYIQISVLQPVHCASRYLCCSLYTASRYLCCSLYTVHLDICAVAHTLYIQISVLQPYIHSTLESCDLQQTQEHDRAREYTLYICCMYIQTSYVCTSRNCYALYTAHSLYIQISAL